jgi:hypothetical protein
MSRPGTGAIIPSKWSVARRELERHLADGAWHEVDVLFIQLERFIDPRVAVRAWARQYDRTTQVWKTRRPPASEILPTCERHAVKAGRRLVLCFWLRNMRVDGRLEVWKGPRRVQRVRLREGARR